MSIVTASVELPCSFLDVDKSCSTRFPMILLHQIGSLEGLVIFSNKVRGKVNFFSSKHTGVEFLMWLDLLDLVGKLTLGKLMEGNDVTGGIPQME
jgi:hypothetical protein